MINNDELNDSQKKELSKEIIKELQAKGTNIIAYIVDSESLLERMKAEEERLTNLRKSGETKLELFKSYVKNNMEAMGIKKIQTELGTMSVCSNPISIEIVDENIVPIEFKKQKVTTSIDKAAIKNHFVSTGELIDGVKIVSNKTSLRIK